MRREHLAAIADCQQIAAVASLVQWQLVDRLRASAFTREWLEDLGKVRCNDKPPCVECHCLTVWFCAVGEIECREYTAWVEEIR